MGDAGKRMARALDDLGLAENIYLRAHLEPPWCMRIPQRAEASYHVAARGRCVVHAGKKRWTVLPGDLLLVPHGVEHTIGDGDVA